MVKLAIKQNEFYKTQNLNATQKNIQYLILKSLSLKLIVSLQKFKNFFLLFRRLVKFSMKTIK